MLHQGNFVQNYLLKRVNFHSNEVDQIHIPPWLAQWCGHMPSSDVTRVDTIIEGLDAKT